MDNIPYNLISRYLAGETNEDENLELERWKNASSRNRDLLVEFEQILQNTSPMEPPSIPDIEPAWLEIESKIGKSGKSRILSFRQKRTPLHGTTVRLQTLAAAALIVLLIGGALLYKNLLLSESWQAAQTKNAERIHVRLPDGSQVQLNADSNIQFPTVFSDSARIVQLSGEAFFEVKHRATPFLVKTENAEIRVMGTSFNVWARDKQTRVVVKTGRVAFNALQQTNNSGVVLSAKQMSSCRSNEIPTEPTDVDSEKLLGWLENRIVFEQTPLAEIISELQRFYDVEIQLADPALGEQTVTGSFHNQPIETVLTSLCLTLKLQYELENNQYVILK